MPEIDLETHLRDMLRAHPDKHVHINYWENNEGRMQMDIEGVEFVVFGQNTKHRPVKPPTQGVAVNTGIDAFGPMGAR